MIFDEIANKDCYRDMPQLYRVLCQMEQLAHTLPQERVELDGTNLYINPVQLTTKPVAHCLYEAHQNYADVHFGVHGTEHISVQSPRLLQLHTPYNALQDCAFFTGEPAVTFAVKPGWFLVCFPQDAHRVCEMGTAPQNVEKLVGKIRVTL
ncbi:MAG: YhcH/YjgK/YiaL family protein [Oscillospiraceae bacterium]|nr:YhcH/YjgK/YiaL family protein [Oscillospiraceae bacterium]